MFRNLPVFLEAVCSRRLRVVVAADRPRSGGFEHSGTGIDSAVARRS